MMETTVLKAKNNLSLLLRKAEQGEEVLIRRGSSGTRFRIVRVEDPVKRTLAPDPQWKDRIAFKEEDVWESEWKEEE
jgi:antitoxin (DNA-binding transcriptional repressor) of toxin-antitoxin stability system